MNYDKIKIDLEKVYKQNLNKPIENILDEVWFRNEVEFSKCEMLTEESEYFDKFAKHYLYKLKKGVTLL
tara:strand:- start:269 stop:475 length:207 start_codon:yes stop_codon:yes gene_type:complete